MESRPTLAVHVDPDRKQEEKMTTITADLPRSGPPEETNPVRLGSYSALAESAWMGSVQASEVLDALYTSPARSPRRLVLPRIPRVRLAGLYLRELSIPEASFVLMASFFLSALLGAVRQVLFNGQFGAGLEANAYYAAFRLPDTLFSLIAGGALSSAMIPVLLKTTQTGGAAASRRLISLVMTGLMSVFLLIVLAGEIFTPFFIRTILAPGFDEPTSRLTVALTRIMLIQPAILALGSVATAVLNSRNQFIPTAASILAHNLTLIGGILAARFVPGLGILGPTIGVVAGAVLQAVILLPGLFAQAGRLRPALDLADRGLREIVRLLIPNGLAVSVNYAGFILDTAFASRAANPGALPALFNAWMIAGLPIALIGQAIGQAVFPRLADMAESGRWKEMQSTVYRMLGAALVLALLALGAILLLGRLTIRVLFEHGKFDALTGDLTFQVLTVYAFALPAYVATELVTRGLIALRDTRTPLLTNTLQILFRFGFMFFAIDRLGVLAIPAAFAISAALETLLLTTIFLTRLGRKLKAGREDAI
jgi:putative peptidoglycan lipid II flippase